MNNLRKTLTSVFCLYLLACTPAPDSPVVVASNDWIGYRPLYLAQQLNYFDEHTVRLLELTSASEVLRKFRNGVIQVAALTLDEALLLKQDGFDITIILVMDISAGADAIVAHNDIADISALRGKTIGVEKSAVGAYLLSRALELAKLSEQDVKTQSLEFGEHEIAFLSRQVDAVVTFEPVRSRLLNNGAHTVFDSSRIAGEIVDVLVVHSDCFRRYPHKIQSLVVAWFKALKYMQNQPSEAIRYLAPLSDLSVQDYIKASKGVRFPGYQENLESLSAGNHSLKTTARKLQTVMRNQHQLQKTLNLDGLFSPSLLQRVQP